MGNHVHLLVSPTQARDLAHAMRLLNQRYVAKFNRRHLRTGTLWEGRFRSCLVDSESYVLALYRYIDLNPVRAAMVEAPEQHVWSSARANLGLAFEPWLTPHAVYCALGSDTRARIEAYRAWLRAGVTDEDLVSIRLHLQQERALGSPKFQAMVAKTLNRPVAVRARGRPRLNATEDSNG
jgi:putative transposase